ncbi:hypothetical protein PR048_027992 [Dryococelus australis]|uniref:Uncharacterized protein n=1 Tax=Dryococelus australis TaxID=614101 RepID=A0ABQ9GI06_9NEOP|nr:hypothetical protein PR048_027992 [Dryococelus australis]
MRVKRGKLRDRSVIRGPVICLTHEQRVDEARATLIAPRSSAQIILLKETRPAHRQSTRVIEVSMEQRRNEGTGETGNPQENPLTSGIVRHDSNIRKSGVIWQGIELRIPFVGGEQANRSATVAPAVLQLCHLKNALFI